MKVISKSRFVSGSQCCKKLYFDVYRKDLKPPKNAAQEALFSAGNEIGKLAQEYFSGGRDATPSSFYDFTDSIKNTRQWIGEGVPTLYEAAFTYNDVLSALDILHHENGERWAIEVKSSTEVKEYHIIDASLQYWVMCKSGFKPDKFFLMHINNKYVKSGTINIKELFILNDITELVIKKQSWVDTQLVNLKTIISNNSEPLIPIGKHCLSPFSCDYMAHCWKDIPADSVFDLSSARGKDWDLFYKGITKLIDIPLDYELTHRQRLQVNGIKNNSSYIDKIAITKFIANLNYPIYFFDFETIFPAIPILNGTSPFQQVAFQYSLHILNSKDSELEHKEFLANPMDFLEGSLINPLKILVERLKSDFGNTGSIMAYNATFEMSIIKSLANMFPEYKGFLEDMLSRFVDLLIPFRNAWYYLPEMGNSASIKSVLPALAPDFSYKDLEVNNGGIASELYYSMIKQTFTGDEMISRNNLLKYCERDTLGMVIIWNKLNEV